MFDTSYYDTLGQLPKYDVTIGRSHERMTWQYYAVALLASQLIAVLYVIAQ